MSDISNINARPSIIITPPPSGTSGGAAAFKGALDVINPLHQIPVVSTIYEKATGDVPNPVSKILGGFLFGGIFGMVAGIASAIVEQVTGKSVADNIASAFSGDEQTGEVIAGGAGDDTFSYEGGVDFRGNVINPYLVASNFTSDGTYAPPGSFVNSVV